MEEEGRERMEGGVEGKEKKKEGGTDTLKLSN